MSQKILQEDLNYVQRAPLEITSFQGDMNIIQQLDDEPNDVGGLTSAQLKAEFDKAGNSIKTYLNETLIPELLASDATEQARETAENKRMEAEKTRQIGESERVNMDAARSRSERERAEAEAVRVRAETARKNGENSRNQQEIQRIQVENSRAAAEQSRIAAEQSRVAGEQTRLNQMNAAVQAANQSAAQAEQAAAASRSLIDDSSVSPDHTWSSEKISHGAVQILDLQEEFGITGVGERVDALQYLEFKAAGTEEMLTKLRQLFTTQQYDSCKVKVRRVDGTIYGVYPVLQVFEACFESGYPGMGNEPLPGYGLQFVITADASKRYVLLRICSLFVVKGEQSGTVHAMLQMEYQETDQDFTHPNLPANAAAVGKSIKKLDAKILNLQEGVPYTKVDEFTLRRTMPIDVEETSENYDLYEYDAILLKITLPASAHGDLGWLYAKVSNWTDYTAVAEVPLIHIAASDSTQQTYGFAKIWKDHGWWRAVSGGQPALDSSAQVPLMINGFGADCVYSSRTYQYISALRSDQLFPKGTTIQVFAIPFERPV